METQTDTPEPENTSDRKQFDHTAIRAALDSGTSAKAVAEQFGCSQSLVQRIKRQDGGGERTPRNIRRAVQLRKKAEQLTQDVDLLTKWLANEATVPVEEGSDSYNGVTELLQTINNVRDELDIAAALYEGLPEEAMKTKRTATRVEFAVDMVVCAKDRHVETYKAICSSPQHLVVRGKRDTHVLVEDDQGTKFFVPAKELQVRNDA